MQTKTIIKPKSTSKNKVVTIRFTLNPKTQAIFERLELEYPMLDRTEIVKVALSKLSYKENKLNRSFKSILSDQEFLNEDDFDQQLI